MMRNEFEKKFNNQIVFRFDEDFKDEDLKLLEKVMNKKDESIGDIFENKFININLRI